MKMRYVLPVFSACLFLSTCCPGAVLPGDDFNGNTATAVSTLQQWYSSGGLWNTTGWWNAANCVDALEYDVLANNDTNYLATLQNTFNLNSGGNFLNGSYDDEGWWAEAWIRAYDLTGNVNYLNMAKTIFSDMTTAWDSHCGGGLWWSSARTYKNAIPNELFLLVAARLHQRTPGDSGTGSYFYWATNEWSWFKSSGMINGQNLINDGLTTNCLNNGQSTWTYNQGVILGGLTELYKITGNTNDLAEAETIANAVLAHLTSSGGVLQEPCEVSGGCGGPDVPEFKGIFARNLACLYDEDHHAAYYNFLYTNANSVWFRDRNSSNQFGFEWTGSFDSADAARQSSAIMPLSVIAEPVTSLLRFAKGSGDPAFNHSVGASAGTLSWACGPATPAGLMQYGPYLTSLPAGGHVVHFRMAVNALSASTSNLVSIAVLQNGATLSGATVAWNDFTSANAPQDFSLAFTNASGGMLEFRVYWNQTPAAPTLTLSDVTIDGAHNWVAANLAHDIGRLDGHNNWEADPIRDAASGYLAKGPGTAELAAGSYDAQFELAVDNFNQDSATVATLSVVNTNTGAVVASRNVARNEFPNTLYHRFDLYFSAVAGGHYDFRTYWYYGTNAPRLTERCVVANPVSGPAFAPIPLTAGSYNEDMVVEQGAPATPNGSYTTASMDMGTANTANGWYEQGYDAAAPTTGLPSAGSTITSQSSTDHSYTLAPSYAANDVAMVDSSHNPTLVPVSSARFSGLSFLTSAGHGPVTVDYQVNHADGTAETGTFVSPDWFFNAPVVLDAEGRVDVVSGAFNNVSNDNPRLYSEDITLTNLASPVTNIHLNWDGNNGAGSVAAVFAVSGVAVQPVSLGIVLSGGQAVLTWPFGQLLQATSLTGPWVTNFTATSPYVVTPEGTNLFYRVQVQ